VLGVEPTDAPTYAIVAGMLAVVAMLAALGPAPRASRTNPMRLSAMSKFCSLLQTVPRPTHRDAYYCFLSSH